MPKTDNSHIASPFAFASNALIIGEVLFDVFPDGIHILGGAPFNVAWHLQGFGASPLFVSGIGQDEPGQQVRAAMHAWGMATAEILTTTTYPTGQVKVKPGPSYDILPQQAYDLIDPSNALEKMTDLPPILYHGSLAWRETASRMRLLAFRKRNSLPTFVDINIRPPWFSHDWLPELLTGIDYLKLNNEELGTLTNQAPIRSPKKILPLAKQLREHYHIGRIIVTCGEHGAVWSGSNEEVCLNNVPIPTTLVDTVGAGDAFAAVCLLGILAGWTPTVLLDRAATFASEICAQRGATQANLALYMRQRDAWHAD